MRHPVVRRGCAPGRLLLLQFGNRRVHLINLFIQLLSVFCVSRSLRVASEIASSCFSTEQAGWSVVVAFGVPRALRGDIGLNRFELVTLIRVGGKAHNNTPALRTLA